MEFQAVMILMTCIFVGFGGLEQPPKKNDGNIYNQRVTKIPEGMKVAIDTKSGDIIIIKEKENGK